MNDENVTKLKKLPPHLSVLPIEFTYMDVSPAEAESILKNNGHNRVLSEKHVARLAGDMGADHWTLTHQPIAVGPDWEIVDGQHRLAAIVRSGVTVRIVLAIYRDAAHADLARQKTDIGRARVGGDVFEIAGIARRGVGKRVYSVVAALVAIERAVPWGGWTTAEIAAKYMREKAGVDFAAGLPHKLFPAPVAAAFAFAYPVAPEGVEAFVQTVTDKVNLAPCSAAHLYVQAQAAGTFASKAAKVGEERTVTSQRVCRLIQMHLEGETMAKLQTSPKGVDYFKRRRAALGM